MHRDNPQNQSFTRPLFKKPVPAGFPSPAEEYLEEPLDLSKHLIPRPEATFFFRVSGDSMKEAGILSGDLLVVDRSLDARDGSIIIAVIDGALTVKRLRRNGPRLCLVPANENFCPIAIKPETDFEVWGVVTHAVHSF